MDDCIEDRGYVVDRVRRLIPDMVLLEDPKDPTAPKSYYFTDAEILGYISEYAGSEPNPHTYQVRRAAADAIDALANNEALVLKKIKTEDLETDGAAVANSLRRGAQALREQADREESKVGSWFTVVPFRHHHPQTRLPYGGVRW